MSPPSNFRFLSGHSPRLADLGATAERLFPFDPASCVLKLRLLAEAITQDITARLGITLIQPSQAELLRAVDSRMGLDARVRQLVKMSRRTGNLEAYEAGHGIDYREGSEVLGSAGTPAGSDNRNLCRTAFHQLLGGCRLATVVQT
jgi:type I restriction enzyme, R subunit